MSIYWRAKLQKCIVCLIDLERGVTWVYLDICQLFLDWGPTISNLKPFKIWLLSFCWFWLALQTFWIVSPKNGANWPSPFTSHNKLDLALWAGGSQQKFLKSPGTIDLNALTPIGILPNISRFEGWLCTNGINDISLDIYLYIYIYVCDKLMYIYIDSYIYI